MTINKIKAIYFSATGTTQKVVRQIVATLSKELNVPSEEFDFTLLQNRQEPMVFEATDFVVFGVPVYAGRVPNVLVKYLNTMQGNSATALSIAVYGNRDFDDALMEATDILENSGMKVIAGGAFVGEHSFSTTLAAGRPDADDLQKAAEFAKLVAEKIKRNDLSKPQIKGVPYPYRQHYQPKDAQQNSFDIRKVKPLTSEDCVKCGLCAKICPMGSINPENVAEVTGICIKCGVCVKKCPTHAKHFDDPNYNYHKTELEKNYQRRAVVEWFV